MVTAGLFVRLEAKPGKKQDDESPRQTHLASQVAATLMAPASSLLAQAPAIAPIDTIASELRRP